MPRGGRRVGAGRPVGSITKKARQVAENIATADATPLEGLMKIANDPTVDVAVRVEAFGKAAPFVHPRLANISTTLNSITTLKVELGSIPSDPYLSAEQAASWHRGPSIIIQ